MYCSSNKKKLFAFNSGRDLDQLQRMVGLKDLRGFCQLKWYYELAKVPFKQIKKVNIYINVADQNSPIIC